MGDAARGDAAGARAPRCDHARRHESNDGYLVKTTGDGVHAAFAIAADAIAACLAAQRALKARVWGELPIKSRMALHSGAAEQRGGDYYGPAVNRAARLMAAGHGGQILLSLATGELVRDHLPADITLRDMGARRLKDLIRPERVYQVIAPDLPADFPPLKTLDARPNNLPAQTTRFIGREKEVRAIKKQLSDSNVRLLTLSGVGGTGKMRLALQAAAHLVDDFEHGVFFVPLAALGDPALVLTTIARTFDVREAAGQSLQEQLKGYLHEKEMLLVLDNFEQVVDAAPIELGHQLGAKAHYDTRVATAHAALGDDAAFSQAWQEGRVDARAGDRARIVGDGPAAMDCVRSSFNQRRLALAGPRSARGD